MSMRFMSVFGAVVLGLLLAGTLDAAPYQELEHREGYVPVYIREGDTPLFDINPKLAEAFNEIDTQNLLEQADKAELEKKPDLILMSVDNGEAMLIAQPADQVVSEDEPLGVIAIVPVSASESQDETDIAEIPLANPIDSDDKLEEGEAPQVEPISQQLAEEGEPIIEEEQQQPELEEEKEKEKEKEQPTIIEDEEIGEVPIGAADDSTDDDHKTINDKPEEQATDVSTVDAFKTKEIDVKSLETEKIDVPEEESPVTVSIDE